MQPSTNEGTEEAQPTAPAPTRVDTEAFLTLPTFRMLALASPVLESFFERDLPSSFHLCAPSSPSSSVPPCDSPIPDASSAPTRRGLGSLFGLVSAPSAPPTKEVRSRPRPSFGGRTLDGRLADTDTLRQDEARLRTASSGSGSSSRPASRPRTPVVQPTPRLGAPTAAPQEQAQALSVPPRPAASKRMSLRGTDMLGTGAGSAAASLAAATAALLASPTEPAPLSLIAEAGGFSEDQPAPEEDEEAEAEERRGKEEEDKALARALKRLSTAMEVGASPGGAKESPKAEKINLALLEHAEEL